jgi:hypothetical protein
LRLLSFASYEVSLLVARIYHPALLWTLPMTLQWGGFGVGRRIEHGRPFHHRVGRWFHSLREIKFV